MFYGLTIQLTACYKPITMTLTKAKTYFNWLYNILLSEFIITYLFFFVDIGLFSNFYYCFQCFGEDSHTSNMSLEQIPRSRVIGEKDINILK